MAEQVGPLRRLEQGRDVRAEFPRVVGIRVIRACRLELAALVDRDDPAAGRGELAEDRDEVFLAAGVAGHEQCRAQLTGARGGQRVKHGETRRAPSLRWLAASPRAARARSAVTCQDAC